MLDAILGRSAWHGRLLNAIENDTIAPGQIDAARRERLINSADKQARALAEKLFAGSTNADRQKVIDQYKSALALAGDKTRGKAVFTKSCSACHLLEGVGHSVGPDLAALVEQVTALLPLRDLRPEPQPRFALSGIPGHHEGRTDAERHPRG